jgi:alcohol dehydrogenase class IV
VPYSFLTPPEILFGSDESRKTLDVARRFGSRPFLVTGARSFDDLPIRSMFAGMRHWSVSGEPDVHTVDEGVRRCGDADVIIAIGGGSVLDSAKAIAGVVANGGSVREYLEQVGDKKLTKTPLPFIAVPTTAGTGSEATKNAVIRVPDLKVKRSIRHDLLMPRVAIVDPKLSALAPRDVAASAALDAFTHLLEGYVSTGAHAMTDALALPGLALAAEGLRGIAAGTDAFASMSQASLWGGIVLANAGLGAVHGLVAPLGGHCAIPHGIGCACLLADTVRVNLAALRSRAPDSPALGRYEKASQALGLKTVEDLLRLLSGYRRTFDLPALRDRGLSTADLVPIVKASRGGSMRFNPIELSDSELEGILRSAMGAS